jgi:outer membrane protein OmpA-like peptidoglycan-associated protein
MICAAGPAPAQVTVDLQALDAVPGAKPAAKHPAAKAKPRSAAGRTAAAKSGRHAPRQVTEKPAPAATPQTATVSPPAVTPAPQSQPAPPAATLPTAPPADVALVPVPPPPQAAQPAEPPPPPPITDTATSAATATGAGLRVTFGAGQADLSQASATAIKNIVQSAPSGDATFNVVAYAAGTPEDPSTARRLSLSRALAVRSALMADGVTSSRIYVRALGAAGGDETPDRVDLSVMGGNAPTASPASANAPDAGAKSQTQ